MKITLKHGINYYDVPTYTVSHITDTTTGKPIVQNRTVWFNLDDAQVHAKSQSQFHPEPNRFMVLDTNDKLFAIWQCGKELPLFIVV